MKKKRWIISLIAIILVLLVGGIITFNIKDISSLISLIKEGKNY